MSIKLSNLATDVLRLRSRFPSGALAPIPFRKKMTKWAVGFVTSVMSTGLPSRRPLSLVIVMTWFVLWPLRNIRLRLTPGLGLIKLQLPSVPPVPCKSILHRVSACARFLKIRQCWIYFDKKFANFLLIPEAFPLRRG